MEKEFIILMMEADMKAIERIIKDMEKDVIIIIMAIDQWVIILKVKKLESMWH